MYLKAQQRRNEKLSMGRARSPLEHAGDLCVLGLYVVTGTSDAVRNIGVTLYIPRFMTLQLSFDHK